MSASKTASNGFHLVEPRSDVEIHLPDGRVLSGKRCAPVGEFLRATDFPLPVVAAVVDGDLRELTFPILMDSNVRPVDMSEPDGALIYRRSLNFLLEMAFADRFPAAQLRIDHSISFGGYYCQVDGRPPLSDSELKGLQNHMEDLVAEDLPFTKQEVPLSEAIDYFRSIGYEDKVRLLHYRRKPYLTLYSLGDRMDYHHGYMVPSTGYLKWFELLASNGGFTLRFPRRHAPTCLEPITPYPQLLEAFRLYGDWLEYLGIDNVGALNDAIHGGRVHEVVLVSEALHEQNITDLAQRIASRLPQIVLIAGPTSSGKTTLSRRLTIQLLARGISPYTLELDNYFVPRAQTPLGEDGQPDFEALGALDLPKLAEHLELLLAGRRIRLPRYNFEAGTSEPGEYAQLHAGQPIIMEGIHGLDPRLLPVHLGERSFKIYASALTQLNLDRHNRVSTTDTRLLRRIVRDARERGYSARETISRWESVRRGEKNYIFPYQEKADVMFNSALVYELSALKPFAEPLLRQVPHGVPEFTEAKRLLAFLEWFLPIDAALIPENSIAREFLGGSILREFRAWRTH
jgi:uridine kinase